MLGLCKALMESHAPPVIWNQKRIVDVHEHLGECLRLYARGECDPPLVAKSVMAELLRREHFIPRADIRIAGVQLSVHCMSIGPDGFQMRLCCTWSCMEAHLAMHMSTQLDATVHVARDAVTITEVHAPAPLAELAFDDDTGFGWDI